MADVCHACPFWKHIRGKNPQNNEEFDRWDCAIAMLPLLMIENSQMQRQTAAAVESFRNEAADSVDRMIEAANVRRISRALDDQQD